MDALLQQFSSCRLLVFQSNRVVFFSSVEAILRASFCLAVTLLASDDLLRWQPSAATTSGTIRPPRPHSAHRLAPALHDGRVRRAAAEGRLHQPQRTRSAALPGFAAGVQPRPPSPAADTSTHGSNGHRDLPTPWATHYQHENRRCDRLVNAGIKVMITASMAMLPASPRAALVERWSMPHNSSPIDACGNRCCRRQE